MLLARLLLFFVLVPGVLQAQALRIGILPRPAKPPLNHYLHRFF